MRGILFYFFSTLSRSHGVLNVLVLNKIMHAQRITGTQRAYAICTHTSYCIICSSCSSLHNLWSSAFIVTSFNLQFPIHQSADPGESTVYVVDRVWQYSSDPAAKTGGVLAGVALGGLEEVEGTAWSKFLRLTWLARGTRCKWSKKRRV